jgi:hypothetical protein
MSKYEVSLGFSENMELSTTPPRDDFCINSESRSTLNRTRTHLSKGDHKAVQKEVGPTNLDPPNSVQPFFFYHVFSVSKYAILDPATIKQVWLDGKNILEI